MSNDNKNNNNNKPELVKTIEKSVGGTIQNTNSKTATLKKGDLGNTDRKTTGLSMNPANIPPIKKK